MEAIEVFRPLRGEIEQLGEENSKISFEYRTATGEKMARSHIFKLRKVKTVIADQHKVAKADALAVCKALDEAKRDLTDQVEAMIAIHQNPLDIIAAEQAEKERLEQLAIQQAEAARIAELEARERAVKEAEERLQAAARAKEALELETMQKAAEEAQRKRLVQEGLDRAEAQKKADEAKRQANQEHVDLIDGEVMSDMEKAGVAPVVAAILISHIHDGQIRHIKIQY